VWPDEAWKYKEKTMNRYNMIGFGVFLILAACLASAAALAEPSGGGYGQKQVMQGMGHHSPGHHGPAGHLGRHHGAGSERGHHGAGGHHGGHHGPGGKHGHHGRKGLYAEHWESSLTSEQHAELDKLKLTYARTKAPLKAKARALKIELALLATAEDASGEAVDKKVDELLGVKRQIMRNKYRYIYAKRQVLTPEQRVSYDMEVLKSAKHKGEYRGHHRH
jgi:Spy/CpxP family protein refolding chaperone